MNNGLADKERLAFSTEVLPRDWATDFTIHFIVISSIVLVLVLAVVLAGIYVPARRISHVNPVDALRDETGLKAGDSAGFGGEYNKYISDVACMPACRCFWHEAYDA